MSVYPHINDYLDDLLQLARIWVERHRLLYTSRYLAEDEGGLSLHVGAQEVDSFLSGALGLSSSDRGVLQEFQDVEVLVRERLQQGTVEAYEGDGTLPLEELRATFGLDEQWMVDLVVALLAPQVEPEFKRAYQECWSDDRRTEVDVAFLVNLVGRDAASRRAIRDFFAREEHNFFRFQCFDFGRVPSAAGHFTVRLKPRLVQFLMGAVRPNSRLLGPNGVFETGGPGLSDVLMEESDKTRVLDALKRHSTGPAQNRVLILDGPIGVGKKMIVRAFCAQIGRPMICVRCSDLGEDPDQLHRRMLALFREARLQNAVLYFDEAELFDRVTQGPHSPEGSPRRAVFSSLISQLGVRAILGSKEPLDDFKKVIEGCSSVRVPQPTRAIQEALWTKHLGKLTKKGFDPSDIVLRYSLSGGVIEAISTALRAIRKPDRKHFQELVRTQLQHRLGSVATQINRGFTRADLIVTKKTMEQLDELVSFMENQEQIFETWGFDEKFSYGKGMASLFYGPPGTGKTMAAGIIAGELGRDIFQIDLSQVVDKYIGETEKNLLKVFDEGRRAQAILLFDEADSLFGKRTAVKSSVDRYANQNVNFLLQQVESYEGICILTTNFAESIDDAFKRRLRFKVHFPLPEKKDRLRLWQGIIPSSTPLADDVKLEALADEYEMSGANIKNVILRAAALAAQRGTIVTQDTFIEAANREYKEMGRLVRDL